LAAFFYRFFKSNNYSIDNEQKLLGPQLNYS